jgi:hypothetical protein
MLLLPWPAGRRGARGFHHLLRIAERLQADCREVGRVLPNTMTPAFRLAAFLTVCLSIFELAPQSRGQVYQGKELVKAELLSDTNAVVPGNLKQSTRVTLKLTDTKMKSCSCRKSHHPKNSTIHQ